MVETNHAKRTRQHADVRFTMSRNLPDFRDPRFLLDHIRHTMAFYHARAIDPAGGFHHFFRDDGSIYNAHTRHLVSSTRFVFNYAMAFRRFGDADYQRALEHGLAFLRQRHRNSATGGYAWLLDDDQVTDAANHCYGLAFVLLAYAHAAMAGSEATPDWIGETFELMERRFWSPVCGLYADEAAADWSELAPYRGQNANMHACEALAGGIRCHGSVALSGPRGTTGAQHHAAPGGAGRRPDLGALPR